MTKMSVIVPAYNAEETLALCLEALTQQSTRPDSYEVILVDDGSTDHTAEVARRFAVHLVRQSNAGAGAARNAGARAASGDLLLFTDADCAPAPDWVERMREAFSDPGVRGAKGVYLTRQKELVARFVQQEYEQRYARLTRRDRIDFVDTYSAGYRREVFERFGGFDPFYRRLQDQELSFRIADSGCRLAFVPEAVVYHLHDRSIGEYWRRKFEIGYWKALLLRRHPGRARSDSHTPQVVKIQIIILALIGPTAVLSAFWMPALWALATLAAAFAASTLPLVWRIARHDRAVLAVAPLLIAIRDLALGLGLVKGFLSWRSGARREAQP